MAEKTANIPPAELIAPAAGLDIKALAQLGADASSLDLGHLAKPDDMKGVPDVIPVAIVNGKAPEVRDVSRLFEPYRQFPACKTGTATAQTFEAFAALTNRHKTDHSVIFADADWRAPSFTTIVDYHHAENGGQADFGKHRIHYKFPLSEEWKAWVKMDGEPMKQRDFAYFLEDRVPELTAPTDAERIWMERDFNATIATPNQLIELSRGLQVNVEAKVKAHHVLQSGEAQIAFDETHQGADGKPVKVPGLFMLQLAPFFMGDKIRMPVRLRYRVAGGDIIWFYQLYRPDLAITEHVRATLFEARDKTGLPAYEGVPEMAGV